MCESSPTTRLYPQSMTKRGPSPPTLRFKSPRAPGKHGAPFQSRTSVAGRRDALPSEDGAHVTTQHPRPPKPAPPKPCSTELPGRWLEAIGCLHPTQALDQVAPHRSGPCTHGRRWRPVPEDSLLPDTGGDLDPLNPLLPFAVTDKDASVPPTLPDIFKSTLRCHGHVYLDSSSFGPP